MTDQSLEDHEATVAHLPGYTGDGYSYGGGVLLVIGPYALPLGESRDAIDLAEELAARWNERRGKTVRPQPF